MKWRCHIEQSKTSLISFGPNSIANSSEIESLASRALPAALQLRSAQNDIFWSGRRDLDFEFPILHYA
jgi:hypothetical protein